VKNCSPIIAQLGKTGVLERMGIRKNLASTKRICYIA
jgi:hypothetical protein